MNRSEKRNSWTGAFILLAGSLAALVGLSGEPRQAVARTGGTTVTSACSCNCNCTSKDCGCLDLGPSVDSCFTKCLVCTGCPSGVAGGGTVRVDERDVTVAVFATAEKENKNKTSGGNGRLRWVDPNFDGEALTLESVGLTAYGPVPGRPNTRAVAGIILANGKGPYPFLLLMDAEPSSGQDTVALTVGDAVGTLSETGFSYTAEGPLVAGDLFGTWTPPG